jgi:hypothetical protein
MSDDTKDKPDLRLVPDDEQPTEVVVEEEPNAPARIDQSPGEYKHVSPQEALQRRQYMGSFMESWMSPEKIYAAMKQQFGMTEKAVQLLEAEICKLWMEEDKRRNPYLKFKRIKQLERSIGLAEKDEAWPSVMKGSELLSKLEGTQAPLAMDIHTTGEINHAHSFARLLNDLPPDELRELIESERKLLGDGSDPPIEVEAVPAEDTEPADV